MAELLLAVDEQRMVLANLSHSGVCVVHVLAVSVGKETLFLTFIQGKSLNYIAQVSKFGELTH